MNKGHTIEVLGNGHVKYIDHLGDDMRVVQAARTSYDGEMKGEEADTKLLKYLFINRHTSPFEQCNITFELKMPIFIMRQFVRHRTFRLNEWSGRYMELPEVMFVPPIWRAQDFVNKQGSYKYDDPKWNEDCTTELLKAYQQAWNSYKNLLLFGVSKEMARICLPLGMFTQIWVNIDLHNLMHMAWLRTDPHAQLEIQELARAICNVANDLFPKTMYLWAEYEPKLVPRDKHFKIDDVWVTK
jgi:thymidylate synthase (FAD)